MVKNLFNIYIVARSELTFAVIPGNKQFANKVKFAETKFSTIRVKLPQARITFIICGTDTYRLMLHTIIINLMLGQRKSLKGIRGSGHMPNNRSHWRVKVNM